MLPPVRSKNAGALQPSFTRRLITPLPPRPPTMKPALSTPGKTATASARRSKSLGIDFSRVAMICSNTRAAFEDCFAASRAFLVLRSRVVWANAAAAAATSKETTKNRMTSFFIDAPIRNSILSLGAGLLPRIASRTSPASKRAVRSFPRRISRQRPRKDPHAGGHIRYLPSLSRRKNIIGFLAVHRQVVVVIGIDHDSLNLETGKEAFAARVRKYAGFQLRVGRRAGGATHWPSGDTSLAPDLEFVFQ